VVSHDETGDTGYRVHVCFGANCTPRGSRTVLTSLIAAVHEAGLSGRVEILATSCRDRCEYGPSVNVYPGPVFYNEVSDEAVADIVAEHLLGGRPATNWLFSSVLARCQPTRNRAADRAKTAQRGRRR